MKQIQSKLRLLALAAGSLAITSVCANAAADDAYTANDMLLFFQNPSGSVGTDQVVYYSLGQTYSVFRNAATPGDGTFGSTISLGNINTILTSTYGADWTGAASSIYAGANGQNGATSALSTTVTNGDYARTVYVTKKRTSAGTVGSANSSSPLFDPALTGVATAISGANNISGMTQPGAVGTASTTLDQNNVLGATAYSAISGGIVGTLGSTFSLGSVNNIVLGLDLFRVAKTTGTNAAAATNWHVANSITATYSNNSYPGSNGARADYLGTVTISSNGDVNFVAVPEPSTYALLALAGVVVFVAVRRRNVKA